jgi:glycosyltransferase involved in cell wall biosynthesis
MASVSVVLTTLNEEKNIERCLGSVPWAGEIIVVDSFSSDRTVQRARAFTDKVYQHEYPGSSRQVERGIGYATGEWVFVIDADEEVTPALAKQVTEILANGSSHTGYDILRKPLAFGRAIEHGGWFPDYQFRFFRRDGYTANHAEVHGGFEPRGSKGKLDGLLLHHTYENIFSYLQKMNDYTSLQVTSKLQANRHAHVSWYHLVLSPLSHFLRMFISKKGYKDGFHGFLLAVLDALYSMALYAKLWEYQFQWKEGAALPPITNAELNKVKHIS